MSMVRDQREITVPIPASNDDFATLVEWAADAQRGGYTLVHAYVLLGGHQRDPSTTGIRLIADRK